MDIIRVPVGVADQPFEGTDLRDNQAVQRALENRFRAAGWDYAKVEFSDQYAVPVLALGVARRPVVVTTVQEVTYQVVPDDEETVEAAAMRVASQGFWGHTARGLVFVPAGQIRDVTVSTVPRVIDPVGGY